MEEHESPPLLLDNYQVAESKGGTQTLDRGIMSPVLGKSSL
jgi:hypothetical protein